MPVSRRCEAARGPSRRGIGVCENGADWPLPVTIKLMSQMIGMTLENGESTVELLEQNHARQLVG